MTPDPSLPAELLELERGLIETRAAVDPTLAARSLRIVRDELNAERRMQRRRWFLAAAAVLLVGWHLSWWGAQSQWNIRAPTIERAQITAYAEYLRELAPELSRGEAERQARLALVCSNRDSVGMNKLALPRPFGMKHIVD